MTPESSPVRPIGKTDLTDRTKAGGKALACAAFLPLHASLSTKAGNLLNGQTGLNGQAPLRIIQDSREQTPFTFTGYPVEVEVGTLAAGDYAIHGFTSGAVSVSIERKALGDLVNCLGAERARFERELQRLLAYGSAALVIESPADDLREGRYRAKLDASAAWQSVLAFSQRYRLPVFFGRDRADAERIVFDFLRHFARDRWKELSALQDGVRQLGEGHSLVRARA